ncbi:hypothetical protein [Actinoplanes sp. NPDC020271]
MKPVLRTRFGDLPNLDDLARRLVADDHEANLARVVNGASLEDLHQL